MTGRAALKVMGPGTIPPMGAGSSATPAQPKPASRSNSTKSPPKECPTRTGASGSDLMKAAWCATIEFIDSPPTSAGGADRSSWAAHQGAATREYGS